MSRLARQLASPLGECGNERPSLKAQAELRQLSFGSSEQATKTGDEILLAAGCKEWFSPMNTLEIEAATGHKRWNSPSVGSDESAASSGKPPWSASYFSTIKAKRLDACPSFKEYNTSSNLSI
jgi:hypothetical protein